ncbi:MAG: F0F1 ATP synthase subunit alpha, partial [Rickettsiales bacterium]|nr:F0F1 ATP synthase subunit alpha [Rickettsiales bacterium]
MAFAKLEKRAGTGRPAKKTARARIAAKEVGSVLSVQGCVAAISGLSFVQEDELVLVNGRTGVAFSLLPDRVLAVMLDDAPIAAGDKAERTGRIASVPVGSALLGRAVDPLGAPIDGGRAIRSATRYNIERPAHGIMERKGVDTPLATGIKAIDSAIPIGRGQRELILGDRQTGKTSIAVDAIIAQKKTGVICIYCAIGGRTDSVAKVRASLADAGALGHSIIVAAAAESS